MTTVLLGALALVLAGPDRAWRQEPTGGARLVATPPVALVVALGVALTLVVTVRLLSSGHRWGTSLVEVLADRAACRAAGAAPLARALVVLAGGVVVPPAALGATGRADADPSDLMVRVELLADTGSSRPGCSACRPSRPWCSPRCSSRWPG